jgi:hypothetical protein
MVDQCPRVSAAGLDWATVAPLYKTNQLLVVEGAAHQAEPKEERWAGFSALQRLCKEHLSKFKETWSVEKGTKQKQHTPAQVLGGGKRLEGNWYVSLILQHAPEVVKSWLDACPIAVPTFMKEQVGVSHSNCIWVFFGQNMGEEAMKGRAEHIDQVYHSGTWHVQLAGTKVWNLRPNLEGE